MKNSKWHVYQTAIYPGTFDPITNGHVDLIERALHVFSNLIVLVAHSNQKKTLFTAEQRKLLIQDCFKHNKRIKIVVYNGLLVQYARVNKINVVIRGLRAISDFEYEFQMATINKGMYSELETFFLMASNRFFYVNSTLVKEVISHGGDVSKLVPLHVKKALREKLCINFPQEQKN